MTTAAAGTAGPAQRLIAGLGNPGAFYGHTRHNIGFRVVDALAEAHGIPWVQNRRFGPLDFGLGRIGGIPVVLAKPLAYMNRSGPPVERLAEIYGISGEEMLVLHDDIDLVFGRIKIKKKGGHGGHRGIKSFIEAFGGGGFARLRLGVGRPAAGTSVSDHVLGPFAPQEHRQLERIVAAACDAVFVIMTKGLEEAMNQFNFRKGAFPLSLDGGEEWNS